MHVYYENDNETKGKQKRKTKGIACMFNIEWLLHKKDDNENNNFSRYNVFIFEIMS